MNYILQIGTKCRRGGVKKSENFADIISASSLMPGQHCPPDPISASSPRCRRCMESLHLEQSAGIRSRAHSTYVQTSRVAASPRCKVCRFTRTKLVILDNALYSRAVLTKLFGQNLTLSTYIRITDMIRLSFGQTILFVLYCSTMHYLK